MKYILVAKNNVERAWPYLAPWILQAVEGTQLINQMEIIKQTAISGGAQIWVGGLLPDVSMVLVTEGMDIDGVPTLVLRIFAGTEMDRHIDELPAVQKWAVENGFRAMQVWGRLGWKRKLQSLGFEPSYLVLTKDLKKELH